MKVFSFHLIVLLVYLSACTAAIYSDPSGASPIINVQTDDPQETTHVFETYASLPTQDSPISESPSTTTPHVTQSARTAPAEENPAQYGYTIIDTNQTTCYNTETSQHCPTEYEDFYGQDAQYSGIQPAYVDNGDGTISDVNTGLMWQKNPGSKMTYEQATDAASRFNLGGYNDWRLPAIKELYSLILFDGTDVSFCPGGTCRVIPFIDNRYFDFSYGDTGIGERVIDSQFASLTKYTSTTMNGDETVFGVNFADGRIKGYGILLHDSEKTFYVLYVRGNPKYGINDFTDNQDGTIGDGATGLTWMQDDSGRGMNWQSALEFCENSAASGYDDWRLPDAKELQSIVDYSRSPASSTSAAMDPLFHVTSVTNEAGKIDYPYYWSSTTHADSSGRGSAAVYIAFGTAPGFMHNAWLDVHGAGAQRSDPKTGSAADFSEGHGPQGDAVRITNYVRCVRSGNRLLQPEGGSAAVRPAMTVESASLQPSQPDIGDRQGSPPVLDGGRQAPQASIDACNGSIQGASCQFGTPGGIVKGTCRLLEQLTCIPHDSAAPVQQ